MRRAACLAGLAGVVAVAALSSGCALGRAAGRAASSLLAAPQKVVRPKDPVVKDARLVVTWVGHATALVQIDDKLILTDPVLTPTVGQLSKRLYEPGVDPDTLPPLDAVLVSHVHFDHLSLGTLSMLEDRIRMLLMPQGGTAYLTDFAFPELELRPWQPWEKNGLRVTAVPVDHVGFRYGVDDAWMRTAFTGYVIQYHGLTVYFGGDSAYDQPDFVATAQRFPGIDVALLPIGPIEPRSIMRRFHMDPAEALQAFFDLGAKQMVPVHYGTFVNSTDEPGDALRGLREATARWSLGRRAVLPLAIGEQHVFLKKGEDVAKLLPNPPPPPPPKEKAKAKPKPAEPAEPKPEKKSTIPEDQDLDAD
jgi:L-ascorbate metabolism protein UlaG (beta-lactamase superfamily)